MTRSLDTDTRLLIGVSGSAYACAVPQLVQGMRTLPGVELRVIATDSSRKFMSIDLLAYQLGRDRVHDSWEPIPGMSGAPHVALGKWADVFAVIPASAHTLGKFAHGLSSDLLSATYLATEAPVLVAPSMAESMWKKPSVQRNVELLKRDGVLVVEPGRNVSITTNQEEGGAVGDFGAPLTALIRQHKNHDERTEV